MKWAILYIIIGFILSVIARIISGDDDKNPLAIGAFSAIIFLWGPVLVFAVLAFIIIGIGYVIKFIADRIEGMRNG